MAQQYLFTATDANGNELWITDGSAAGTYRIKDIAAGASNSIPADFAALGNGRTVFTASTAANGRELWVTNGTAAGTTLLKDIVPGAGGSESFDLTRLGNKVLFRASTAANGEELWVTDGTAAGTKLLKDISPGATSSFPRQITRLGDGRAIFAAGTASTGTELWVTDGTSAGTRLVKDIRPGADGSDPVEFVALGDGRALFSAIDVNGEELWVTDGTAAGTGLVKDIDPGDRSGDPQGFASLGNGKVLFSGRDDNGRELWVTDGTEAGTTLVQDLDVGTESSFPEFVGLLDKGKALFAAEGSDPEGPGVGRELYVTDGTPNGTRLVKDIEPGTRASAPRGFASLGGGRGIFYANTDTFGYELWVTDGTFDGTQLVKDINPGQADSGFDATLVALGDGRAIFSARTEANGAELWITDGTAAGTTLLEDLYPGGASSLPLGLAGITDITAPATPAAPFLAAGSDTGASASDGVTRVAAPIVAGTAEAGSQVSLYEGTTFLGSTMAEADGRFNIQSRALADGSHTLRVMATDAAGNTSALSAPRVVTVDTSAPARPAAPRLVAASDTGSSSSDRLTKDATPTFTGTAEAGATVALFDGGNPFAVGTAVAGSNGAYSITVSALADGLHRFAVLVVDRAGNVSAVSPVTNVTIDATKPATPGAPALGATYDTGVSNADGITKSSTLVLTGTAETGSTVSLLDGTTQVATTVAGANGYSFTRRGVTAGAHAFSVTATDKAGNVSTRSSATAVTVDTTAPAAPTRPALNPTYDTGVSASDGLTRSTTLVLTGTAEAGATVTLLDGTTQVATTVAAANGAYSFARNGVTPGTHAFSATATDKAGNLSAKSAATAVTVDTTIAAPTKPALKPVYDTGTSSTDGITRSTTLVFTGTAEAGSTVTLYDGATSVDTAVAAANGAYSFGLSNVAEGTHAYKARAIDKAGNVSANSALSTVTVDRTAPDVAITSPGGATTRADQTIKGTGEAGTTVVLTNNGATVGTTTVASNGLWSRVVTLASGSNKFSATDTDKAGNVGTSTAVTYSYTPPAARQMAMDTGASAPAMDGSAAADSAFTQALFDATFSPASGSIASTHAAAAAHPTLAAYD